jgi:16S rRNA (guanine1207-N2)-methyltransferase
MIALNKHTPTTSHLDKQKFQVKLGNLQFEIFSQTGMPNWKLSSPLARLVVENIVFRPADRVLLFGCLQGALPAYLALTVSTGQLSITDHNFSALELVRLTLSANSAPDADMLEQIELPLGYEGRFNVVLIQIPKGRSLTRRWLVQAYQALTDEGSLYIVGSNRLGIQSIVMDAQELFGLGRILSYKKGSRLAHFIKHAGEHPLPDWAKSPGVAPHTWVEFSIRLSNRTFKIRSLPGIFSYDRLDEGTEMLLGAVQIPSSAKVLDAGCGYGIIGLFAAVEGAGFVHLIDNNLLAVEASRETLSVNGINNAEVSAGDLLNPWFPDQYDLVLSNPPFHAGQAVDYQVAHALIENSYRSLNPGGRLIIVANRFIRYNRLIQEIYGNISILAESGKFHVLCGLKSG